MSKVINTACIQGAKGIMNAETDMHTQGHHYIVYPGYTSYNEYRLYIDR